MPPLTKSDYTRLFKASLAGGGYLGVKPPDEGHLRFERRSAPGRWLQSAPELADRTAIYLVAYELTFPDGAREGYPVELLRFQRGRGAATLYYSSVFSQDGSRPCTCELKDARLVSRRLAGT